MLSRPELQAKIVYFCTYKSHSTGTPGDISLTSWVLIKHTMNDSTAKRVLPENLLPHTLFFVVATSHDM